MIEIRGDKKVLITPVSKEDLDAFFLSCSVAEQ